MLQRVNLEIFVLKNHFHILKVLLKELDLLTTFRVIFLGVEWFLIVLLKWQLNGFLTLVDKREDCVFLRVVSLNSFVPDLLHSRRRQIERIQVILHELLLPKNRPGMLIRVFFLFIAVTGIKIVALPKLFFPLYRL